MAYCPTCGREQRCGCATCHSCGVELVERRAAQGVGAEAPRAGRDAAPGPQGPSERPRQAGSVTKEAATARKSDASSSSLPVILLLLGSGILLVTLIEAANSALEFPPIAGSSAADGLKQVGYYMGNLLYSGSVRTITGFAVIAAGLLLRPEGPFADSDTNNRAVRGAGLVMGITGVACFVAIFLLLLPVGTSSLMLKGMLPSLWAAVCIIGAVGVSLLAGGYMMAVSPGGRRKRGPGTAEGASPVAQERAGGR